MDDQALFSEAMGKVKRLKSTDKINIDKAKSKASLPEIKQRPTHPSNFPSHATSASQRLRSTDNPWVLLADGISRDTIKRLAAGRPVIGLNFDLHGMTRHASLTLLQDGVQQAMRENIRALCIVHGRGLHSQDNKPILKQAVYHWLREGSLVLLCHIPKNQIKH
ncbi:MAG: Smr/MutS family protein [Mariprofundus sp.]|nr:Smr/MutS family protein [Mariprofundus sp.]